MTHAESRLIQDCFPTTDSLAAEFRRIGLEADVRLDGDVCVATVDGWPDAIRYDVGRLVVALRDTADGAAATEEGDAAFCRRCEEAGAYLGAA